MCAYGEQRGLAINAGDPRRSVEVSENTLQRLVLR